MKKWFFYFLIFTLGAVFGRPLAFHSLGLLVRAFVYIDKGWSLHFEELSWKEGTFVFSKVALEVPSFFTIEIPSAVADFKKKRLELFYPDLKISSLPLLEKQSEWSLSIREGSLEGFGLKKGLFSLEQPTFKQPGTFTWNADQSSVYIEFFHQGNELWLDAQLAGVTLDCCNRWPGGEGRVDGSCHLVFEEGKWKRGSLHIDLAQVGFAPFFSAVDGRVDWQGDAISHFPSSWEEAKLVCEEKEEQLRVVISHGFVKGLTPISHTHASQGGQSVTSDLPQECEKWGLDRDLISIVGDLTIHSGFGAKWDFVGTLSHEIPYHWGGKAFFSKARSHWVESFLDLSDSRIWLSGKEDLIEAGCDQLGPLEWSVVQPFLGVFDQRYLDWQMIEGQLSMSGKQSIDQGKWDIACVCEQLLCQGVSTEIGCQSMRAFFTSTQLEGTFLIEEGHVSHQFGLDKTLFVNHWNGSAKIQEGVLSECRFTGSIQDHDVEMQTQGNWKQFTSDLKMKEAAVSLKGRFEDETLSFSIDKGSMQGFSFSGVGSIDQHLAYSLHLNAFEGPIAPFLHRLGLDKIIEGEVWQAGFGCSIEGSLIDFDWACQLRGKASYQHRLFSFYIPLLNKQNGDYQFDIRVQEAMWDLARFSGYFKQNKHLVIASEKSHVLGSPIAVEAVFDGIDCETVECVSQCQATSLIPLLSHLHDSIDLSFLCSLKGVSTLLFSYAKTSGSSLKLEGKDLTWNGVPFLFDLIAQGCGNHWHVSECHLQNICLQAELYFEATSLRIENAIAYRKPDDFQFKTQFQGTFDSLSHFNLSFFQAALDLKLLEPLFDSFPAPFSQVEGILQGSGSLISKQSVEADFDFTVSSFRIGTVGLEQRTPMHLAYSTKKGISLSGIDVSSARVGEQGWSDFNCKIDLFSYDKSSSLWCLQGTHLYLPPDLIPTVPLFYSKIFDPTQPIECSADFCGTYDCSEIACSMKEGFLPIQGGIRHLQNLRFCLADKEIWAQCDYMHQGHLIHCLLETDGLAPLNGVQLTLTSFDHPLEPEETPLKLYWTQTEAGAFSLQEAVGSFSGCDLSFHATDQTNVLIGTAKFDCALFSEIVPSDIQRLFQDLEMGQGYELKGIVSCLDTDPQFSGLLSGKQFDLFGYQLRTLLAKIEIGSKRVFISDLKISDSAAIVKIEQALAESLNDQPWTIQIPHINVSELRPSLLQKVGGQAGTISPLVVRSLQINDFQGLLDDSSTYTAKGELQFINSYRREHTVFDIPADLLGRIVGLDLELLTPACGILSYELKDRKFFLKELTNAYSEGRRSEFFLVPFDPVPIMDWDGTLHILVTCKQFVLFKFMDSFMISIEGKLNDPKFHLQKKRRFWGL